MFHWIIFPVLIVHQNLFFIALPVTFSRTWTSHAGLLKMTSVSNGFKDYGCILEVKLKRKWLRAVLNTTRCFGFFKWILFKFCFHFYNLLCKGSVYLNRPELEWVQLNLELQDFSVENRGKNWHKFCSRFERETTVTTPDSFVYFRADVNKLVYALLGL